MAATMIRGGCQADNDAFLTTGIIEIPSVPNFYKPLSLRLCKILDIIGASEDTRKRCMDTFITNEIVRSWRNKNFNISCYIFGSRTEGTTSYGLKSDSDFFYCNESCEILQCISELPLQHKLDCRLMVRDGNTKPGYCKLQWVVFQIPITQFHVVQLSEVCQFDCNNRVVQAAKPFRGLLFGPSTLYTPHGPAMAAPATSSMPDHDIVEAYKCRSWPNAASEWLYRERKYGWPSQDLIKNMKNLGFYLVKVGHPHSSEQNLEWRISLSLQERLLMFSLNPTQFKCYILLKMVKKDNINKKLGLEAISSYHCKTCLFYMIENTPRELWQPTNLLACLQGCLKCIYRWVKVGNCPNYFIPEENMFEGRLDDKLRIKLEKICHVLLTADCGFLLSIQCDDVGKRMVDSVFPMTATSDYFILVAQRLKHYIERTHIGSASLTIVLRTVRNSTTTEVIREIFRCIYDLSHAIPIKGHTCTTDQIRTAACITLPHLEISLISIIIVNKVEMGEAETAVDLLLSSKWQELRNRSDGFTAKLKQATFLYMLGQYEACQEVLKPLVNKCSSLRMSSCHCKPQERYWPNTIWTAVINDVSWEEFKTSHFAPCIGFSWPEQKLIPTALAYEMLRSKHMSCASREDYVDPFSLAWAMIDSQIFLWFLMFLLSKATGIPDTAITIERMEQILNTDLNIGHRDTAMNLIGWCYKQEKNIGKALKYFYRSLALVKHYNAAFWHILFILCEMIPSKLRGNSN